MSGIRKGITGPLHKLARLYGLQTSYYDIISRRRRQPSVEALAAVLRALGVPLERIEDAGSALREGTQARWRRGLEPVVVAWEGKGEFELRLPASQAEGLLSCHLQLETGDDLRWDCRLSNLPVRESCPVEGTRYVMKRLRPPGRLPWGYHRLRAESQGTSFEAHVIAAPRQGYVPPEGQASRSWGVFLPLYALSSRHNWGSGTFSDLERLLEWVGQQGGSVVATLPFLAALLDEPFDPSPYAPVSRLFWNEFYLDITRIPELGHCPAAQSLLASAEFEKELDALRASPLVDYRRGMALKRRVLEELGCCLLAQGGERRAAFTSYVEKHPLLRDYASFRATLERRRTPWPAWPRPQRDGVLQEDDYQEDAQHYHLYVQWLAHEQLRHFAEKARQKGPGLYLDLPLGVHPDGYDAWRHRSLFAEGVAVGSPPDRFFTQGQNWGFSPLHPEKIREHGNRYFIDCVRHHLLYAGMLRIDHVMGLHRLFWVPHGMKPVEGVYVRYHTEELYAILTLESRRHQALIVGEDLGLVPRYVRPTMAQHKVQRVYVLQYELRPHLRRPLRPIPTDSLAATNTHDMSTFASFWRGDDIQDRLKAGLLSTAGARRERENRRRLQETLVAFLRRRGWHRCGDADRPAVLRACLAYLGASRARVVIANLEDLWGEEQPQNVPGTWWDRINWRRKARYSLEEFCRNPEVLDTWKELNSSRRGKGNT